MESVAIQHREETSSLRKQLADLQASTVAERAAAARQHQEEVTALGQQVTDATAAGTAAQLTHADLVAQNTRTAEELAALRHAVSDLTAAKIAHESTVNEVSGQLRRSEQDREHAVRSLTEVTASAAAAKAAAEKSVRDWEAQASRTAGDNASLKQSLFDSEAAVRTLEDEGDRLQLALRDKTALAATTGRELEQAKAHQKKQEVEIAALRELADLAHNHANATAVAEASIASLELQSKKDHVELERARRQLLEAESHMRRTAEDVDRYVRLVDDLSSAKGGVEKELEGLKVQARKDAEALSTLKRALLDGEIRSRKDADEIDRMSVHLGESSVAKVAADKANAELVSQLRRATNDVAVLRKDVEYLTAEQTSAALLEGQVAREREEMDRTRRALSDVTAAKGSADRIIAELQGAARTTTAELDTARRQLLEGELAVRKGRDESERLQKLLDDTTAGRSAAEKAYADLGVGAKRDREEADKLRKDLNEADSQRRRDGDEITRLGNLLADSVTARKEKEKVVADLETAVKRLRDEVERGKKQVEEVSGAMEGALADAADRRKADREEIAALNKTVSVVTAAAAEKRGRGDEVDRLNKQLHDAEEAKDGLARTVAELHLQLKREGEESSATKKKLTDVTTAKAAAEWQTTKDADELDRLRRALSDAQTALAEATAQGKADRGEIDRLSRAVAEGESHRRIHVDECSALRRQLSDLTEAALAAKTTTDQALGEWRERGTADAAQVALLRGRVLELETHLHRSADEVEGLRRVVERVEVAKGEAEGSLAETRELARRQEETLGRTIEALERGAEEAREQARGQAETVHELTTRVAMVEGQRDAALAAVAVAEGRVGPLEEQMAAAQASSEASRLSALEGVLRSQREAEDRVRLQRTIDELVAGRAGADASTAEVEGALRSEREEHERCRRVVFDLESEVRKKGDEVEQWKARGEVADRQLEGVRGQLRVVEGEGASLHERVAGLTATNAAAEREVAVLTAAAVRVLEDQSALQARLADGELMLSKERALLATAMAQVGELTSAKLLAETNLADAEARARQRSQQDKDELALVRSQLADLSLLSSRAVAELDIHRTQTALETGRQGEADRLTIATLRGRVAALESASVSDQAALTALTLAHQAMTTAKAAADKDVADLRAARAVDTGAIRTLQGRSADLEQQRVQLTAAVQSGEKGSAHLTTQLMARAETDAGTIASLRDEVVALQARVDAGRREVEEVRGRLAEVVKGVGRAKTEADKRVCDWETRAKKDTEEIAALKEQVAVCVTDREKDRDEIAALKKQLADAQAQGKKDAQTIADLQAQGKKDTDKIALLKKQLADVTDKLTALAKEYAGYKDTTAKTIGELEAKAKKDAQTIAELQAQGKKDTDEIALLKKQVEGTSTAAAAAKAAADKRIVELEAQGKKNTDDTGGLTKQLADLTASSAAAKAAADKRISELVAQGDKDSVAMIELRAQGKQDACEIAAVQNQSADLQALQKKTSDELAALTKLYKDLMTAKAAADKEILGMKAQGKTDTDEIAALKKQLADGQALHKKTNEELAEMTKKHADLTKSSEMAKAIGDKAIATLKDDLKKSIDAVAALKKQLADAQAQGKKDAQTIADLQAQGKKDTDEIAALKKQLADMTDKLMALAKEYAGYKEQMEGQATKDAQTIADLQAQGKTDTDEIAALKKQLEDATTAAAAAKVAADKRISEIEEGYAEQLAAHKLAVTAATEKVS